MILYNRHKPESAFWVSGGMIFYNIIPTKIIYTQKCMPYMTVNCKGTFTRRLVIFVHIKRLLCVPWFAARLQSSYRVLYHIGRYDHNISISSCSLYSCQHKILYMWRTLAVSELPTFRPSTRCRQSYNTRMTTGCDLRSSNPRVQHIIIFRT